MAHSGKVGLIDVGGGMRGSYGAGVLDTCLEAGVGFDYAAGVSAGAANISAFLAGQQGRNIRFYSDYAFRPEYMGVRNYLKSGNYINLEYIYGTLSNSTGEDPLDFQTMVASDTVYDIVVTNAETGLAEFISASSMQQDDYWAIKASSNVPGVDKPYIKDGVGYFDGGVADPIPLDRVFEQGCERAVVLLTRPKDYRRPQNSGDLVAKLLERKYPHAAEAMRNRAEKYNMQLDRACGLEKEGKVLVVAPDDIGKMDTLSKDKEAVVDLYIKGLTDGLKVVEFLSR